MKKAYCRGHCKMLELQINKVVDPAFYTDHDNILKNTKKYPIFFLICRYLVIGNAFGKQKLYQKHFTFILITSV